jgi:hypothetical protein
MKKTMYVFGVAASLLLASCGGTTETAPGTDTATDTPEATKAEVEPEVVVSDGSSIVGAWQMTDMNLGVEMTTEQEAEMAALMAEMVTGSVYTFNEDGTMAMVTPQGNESGTYMIVPGGEGLVPNLIATSDGGEEQVMMLTELSDNKLVLTMDVDGNVGTMTFSR